MEDLIMKRVDSLTTCLRDKEEFIAKLNGECTELHQRIITLGRVSGVKIDSLTKRLHDTNDFVTELQNQLSLDHDKATAAAIAERRDHWHMEYDKLQAELIKLQERNGILESVLDMKTGALAGSRATCIKLRARVSVLVTNCDALTEAIRKVEEWRDYWKKGYFEVYAELEDCQKAARAPSGGWRGRYWEVVGKLAARRDKYKYLVKQNEGLKAKLKDLEDYYQRYYVKTQKELHAAKIDQDYCHKAIADLRVERDHRDIDRMHGKYWFKQYQRVAEKNQVLEERLKASQ